MTEEKIGTPRGFFSIASYRPWSDWGRLGRLAASLLVIITVLLAMGCSGGGQEKIAFVSDRDGDPEIYIMNVDGSKQTPITNNGAVDEAPRFSPDKKWVAFVSEESGNREINRMELGKKEPLSDRLTHSPGADGMHRWSPDGRRIAFVSNRDRQPEIYLMDANGSNFTRVTSDPTQPLLHDWSPDGQWIAFTIDGSGEEQGIITRNPDGVNILQLTKGLDYDVTWSRDGQRIVLTSERDDNPEIYVMNADGSGQTRLTHNTTPDFQPSWSPDGKQLVLVSERDGNPEIYVMQADGAAQIRLTFNDAKDDSPVWSPDGKKIAFVSYMYGTGEIFIMDADGNHQFRVTNNSANDTQPAW